MCIRGPTTLPVTFNPYLTLVKFLFFTPILANKDVYIILFMFVIVMCFCVLPPPTGVARGGWGASIVLTRVYWFVICSLWFLEQYKTNFMKFGIWVTYHEWPLRGQGQSARSNRWTENLKIVTARLKIVISIYIKFDNWADITRSNFRHEIGLSSEFKMAPWWGLTLSACFRFIFMCHIMTNKGECTVKVFINAHS